MMGCGIYQLVKNSLYDWHALHKRERSDCMARADGCDVSGLPDQRSIHLIQNI